VRPRVRSIGTEELDRSIFSLLFAHSWGLTECFAEVEIGRRVS
jgi:hypothetical protein